jgi:3',5'-cyclic AMP phosphodiesterase CpdA
MPIYLPPVSRRRFLGRTLAAAAGLALKADLFAAEKGTDENFWALFSDTHIAADRAEVVRNVNMTDHLTSVVREVVALPERPAGIFINGDCAYNSGEKEDYRAFTSLLEPLRKAQMPTHLTLGNHDNREHFWDVLQNEKAARRPLADKQALLLATPLANWFVLDSLEKTLSTPGLLGEQQLDWLAKSLDANDGKPALVMVHHNPGAGGKSIGLKDTEALFKVIRPRKQVKAYLFGHTHVWNVTQDESGIHLVNLPPIAYVFQEGQPSGWVRATLANDGMKLELRCLDTTHRAHGEVKELKWRV